MTTSTHRNQNRKKTSPVVKIGLALLLVVIAVGAILSIYRLVTGKSLGLRGYVAYRVYLVKNLAKAIQGSSAITSTSGNFQNIVFLHHSTGTNLIRQGNMRELFREAGYNFWDHGYNEQGLRTPEGASTGYNYNIPGDNTNPGGFYRIFNQTEYPFPLNAYSGLLQHEVIIFKSCFRPTNHIRSDEQLEQYKTWYLGIRDEMDRHPEKIFIIITAPPLNPAETNPEEAARARIFADWLKSDEYLDGHANVFTFDFFNVLAESDPDAEDHNMLQAAYRDGNDSHPNQLANETIAPILVDFIIEAIESYR
ncbi:MAG TPA: hypothetical protein EYP88_06315 [Anaerolineales bacterium]|nr:hypothetical protein [Anaerolineales bacterium]